MRSGSPRRSRSPRRSPRRSRTPPRRNSRSPPRGGNRSPRRTEDRGRSETNSERISLLVKNIGDRSDGRDLKEAFERYGHVKDVYIPTDFHTRRPKPFAFVEFINYDDACDAKDGMDRREFQGRVIDVVFAQQKRKSAGEMRSREGPAPRRYSRSPRRRDSRSPPRRRSSPPPRRERSRDPSPRRDDDRGRGRDD